MNAIDQFEINAAKHLTHCNAFCADKSLTRESLVWNIKLFEDLNKTEPTTIFISESICTDILKWQQRDVGTVTANHFAKLLEEKDFDELNRKRFLNLDWEILKDNNENQKVFYLATNRPGESLKVSMSERVVD